MPLWKPAISVREDGAVTTSFWRLALGDKRRKIGQTSEELQLGRPWILRSKVSTAAQEVGRFIVCF